MTATSAAQAQGAAGEAARRVRSRRGRFIRQFLVGAAFLAPLVLGLLVFRVFALGYNVYLSFTETGAFGAPRWIGTENYLELLDDGLFRQSVVNTLKFVVLGVPPIVVASIGAAMVLNMRGRATGTIRTILFLPAVTLPVATLLIFAWMFNTDYGIVNSLLQALGGDAMNWFGTNTGVTTVFVVTMTYLSCSIPMLVILANLQSISPEYYEAAALDGASGPRQFWHITLPLITPSIFYVTTTNIISMFQMFSLAFVLLPEGSSGLRFGQTIVHYYYTTAFVYSGQRGYAAAISLVLFAMILVVTLINFRLQKLWVHYDN